jgi:trehalose 6-phosphate synthase/phosphatase
MLLPALLRDRLPGARTGFFLHVPFPSSEVFRILP